MDIDLSYVGGKKRSGPRFDKILPPGGTMPAQEVVRVIPLEEVAATGDYSDLADLAVIFNHEIVETTGGIWRWRKNAFADWIHDYAGVYTPAAPVNKAAGKFPYGQHCEEFRASLNLNILAGDLHAGAFSMEEWMKFYMQIGYSLSGFGEVFGQHEASEYKLPGAKQRTDDDNPDEYVETVIEYMRRTHQGRVLKL